MQEQEERWSALSLRFFGDALILDDVTDTVALIPHTSAKAGEHFRGNPRYARHKRDIWVTLIGEGMRCGVPELVDKALEHIEGRGVPLRSLATRDDVTAELVVTYSPGHGLRGFTLPSDVLTRLSSFGFGLSLNFNLPESTE